MSQGPSRLPATLSLPQACCATPHTHASQAESVLRSDTGSSQSLAETGNTKWGPFLYTPGQTTPSDHRQVGCHTPPPCQSLNNAHATELPHHSSSCRRTTMCMATDTCEHCSGAGRAGSAVWHPKGGDGDASVAGTTQDGKASLPMQCSVAAHAVLQAKRNPRMRLERRLEELEVRRAEALPGD